MTGDIQKGNDLKKSQTYKPISFFNIDYNMCTIVLAEYMRKYITKIIHRDQIVYKKENSTFFINALEFINIERKNSTV